jgi:hypothetical protein
MPARGQARTAGAQCPGPIPSPVARHGRLYTSGNAADSDGSDSADERSFTRRQHVKTAMSLGADEDPPQLLGIRVEFHESAQGCPV